MDWQNQIIKKPKVNYVYDNAPVEGAPLDVDGTIPPEKKVEVEKAQEVVMQEERVRTPPPVMPEIPSEPLKSLSTDAEPSKQSGMTTGDWLAGATPLLVDFLMGGNQGTAIAAEHFTKKGAAPDDKKGIDLRIQKMKLAAEEFKTRRAMKGASGKNDKLVQVNKDGKPVWEWSSQAAGQEAVPSTSAPFNPLEYKHPDGTIRIATFNKATGAITRSDNDPVSTDRNPISDYWATKGTVAREKLENDKIKALAAKMKAEKEIQGMEFKKEKDLYDKRNTDQTTKGTMEMARNFEAIQKAGRRWAQDPKSRAITEQELVVAYLKSIDPSSVARESEQLGVVDAKGALEILYTAPERLQLGQRLTKDQVRGLLESAKQRWTSQNKTQDSVDNAYLSRGKKFGISLDSLNRPKVDVDDYSYLKSVSDKSRVKVTRISDGVTIELDEDKAKTLDKSKYKIGE